jgi:hypothetical protein
MDDTEYAAEQAKAFLHGALERGARIEREKEFRELDHRELAAMTDKQLAEWQSRYPSDSAQHILAEHEWQRRLTAEQVRATRFAAFVGIIGAAVGTVIGWLLSAWHPFH